MLSGAKKKSVAKLQTGGMVPQPQEPNSGFGIASDSGPLGVAAPGVNPTPGLRPNTRIGY